MKFLVIVIRSKNRHIEIFVNVSVANVFVWSRSDSGRKLGEHRSLVSPGAIPHMHIWRTLETHVGSYNMPVCQSQTRFGRRQVRSRSDVQTRTIQHRLRELGREALTPASKMHQSSNPTRLTIHIRVANRSAINITQRVVTTIVVARRPPDAS